MSSSQNDMKSLKKNKKNKTSSFNSLLLKKLEQFNLKLLDENVFKNDYFFKTEYLGKKIFLWIKLVDNFSSLYVSNSKLLEFLNECENHVCEKYLSFTLNKHEFENKFNLSNKKPTNTEIFRYLKIDKENYEQLKAMNLKKSKKSFLTFTTNPNEYKLKIITLKKGFPLSPIKENQEINNLTSREWIKFTKSWFILNPKKRNSQEILHPAKYPEEIAERYIKFFSKPGMYVFDPFLGVGSTIIAAINANRKGIGIELSPKYYNIANERCKNALNNVNYKTLDNFIFKTKNSRKEMQKKKKEPKFRIFNNDSRNILEIWNKFNLPLIDLCVTSPPYWNQLKKNSLRQSSRIQAGLDTCYSENPDDLGNIDDYSNFLREQKDIFENVYQITREKGFLIIITNNIYQNERMYPLAFDTVKSLEEIGWIPLDEQIWCQNDKSLKPIGIFKKYMGNRCHQYCLIFKK